jgi:hypothetical protein
VIKLFEKRISHLFASLLIAPLLWVDVPAKSQTVLPGAGSAAIAQSSCRSNSQPNSDAGLANRRQEIAEQFLQLLFTQQYEAATDYISPTVKNEFPAAVLRQKVEEFQQGTGAFVSRLDSQVEDDVVAVNLLFEKKEVVFIVGFDENLNILNANYVLETDEAAP